MPPVDTGESFDAFLAELAQTQDAPVQAVLLPNALRSATLIGGRFRVERRIGRGGMGEVYLATDTELDRPVAIKVAQSIVGSAAGRVWVHEAEALARLSHPNVVEVFHVHETRGHPYIVMAWVPGETLADWAQARPGQWHAVLTCYRQAGAGLAAAHAARLVHRDFKPHNVVVGVDGRVRVVDFGLAAEIGGLPTDTSLQDLASPPDEPVDAAVSRGTASRAGSSLLDVGTAVYAAPEQHAGQDPDPRSDQFSFCAALYEGLFGTLPFGGATAAEIRAHKLAGTLVPPPRGIAPRWLVAALRRGLRAAPSDRFSDMAALLHAIDPEPHRRRRQAGLAAAGGAVLVAVGLWLARAPSSVACETVAATIEAEWNPSRAGALRTAFVATQSPLAQSAGDHATTALDAYAARWSDQRLEACRDATTRDASDDAQAPTRLCLNRAQVQLQATVDVLLAADRTVVANAREILDALPPLADCLDAEATLAGAPPLDDARGQALVSSRRLTAQADALRAAGHLRPALARADEALRAARASGFDPAIAEALVAHGTAASATGHTTDGIPALEEAYWLATAAHHDRVAARAAREVLRHVVTDPRHVEVGERWARMAQAAQQRLGPSETPPWALLEAQARAALGAEDYDRARDDFVAALAAQERQGVEVTHRIAMLCQLSVLEFRRMRTTDAIRWAERAVALARETLPPEHPVYATALVRHGQAISFEAPSRGIAGAREGLSILQRAYGPDAPAVVGAIHTLANLIGRAGDPRGAVELAREALTIVLARTPVDPEEEGVAHFELGGALLDAREFDAAEAHYRQAAELYEDTLGPHALDRGLVFITLASIAGQRGDYAGADASLSEALAILRPLVPNDSLLLAGALANRGQIRVAQQGPRDGLRDLDEALAILSAGSGHAPNLEAIVELGRGFAFLALDQPQRASEAGLRALGIQRRSQPAPTIDSVQTSMSVASILQQAGDPAQAHALLEEALVALDAMAVGGPQRAALGPQRAALLQGLAEAACALGTKGATCPTEPASPPTAPR